MIAYIEGKIQYKSPTHVYIDIGGIAYDIQISLNTYAQLEALESTKLFTHLIVREDAHTLYGFMDTNERDLFVHLISVSGIGPNTARVILSYMSPRETVNAIVQGNVVAFKKVKGVGPKTAQRIILDLKDKLAKLGMVDEDALLVEEANSSVKEEALSALMALGFQKNMIMKQIEKVCKDKPDISQVEELIKLVLKQLS